jgi:hypothetical protein
MTYSQPFVARLRSTTPSPLLLSANPSNPLKIASLSDGYRGKP